MQQISVVDPVSRAVDWTTQVLFRPFDLAKWLAIGFAAWLAFLGQRGGGSGANWSYGGGDPGRQLRDTVEDGRDWLADNLYWILPLLIVLVVFAIGLTVLFTWLSSRAKFVFVDQVLRNRSAVAEPWREYGRQGNSLFLLRLLLGIVALVLIAAIVVPLLLWVIALWDTGDFPLSAALGIAIGVMAFVGLAILFALIRLGIDDLLVPVMYLRRCGVSPAVNEVLALVGAHVGTFALYVLFRILIALVTGVIGVFVVICTCCIAALPYIGTVILLPLYVFVRSYALAFLAQFGPDYAALSPAWLERVERPAQS